MRKELKVRTIKVVAMAGVCILGATGGVVYGGDPGGDSWAGLDGLPEAGEGVVLATDFLLVPDLDLLSMGPGVDIIAFGTDDAAINFGLDVPAQADGISWFDEPGSANDQLIVRSDSVVIEANGGGTEDDSGSVIIQLGN